MVALVVVVDGARVVVATEVGGAAEEDVTGSGVLEGRSGVVSAGVLGSMEGSHVVAAEEGSGALVVVSQEGGGAQVVVSEEVGGAQVVVSEEGDGAQVVVSAVVLAVVVPADEVVAGVVSSVEGGASFNDH